MILVQDEFLPALFQLIAVRTGLQTRQQDQTHVHKKILARMQVLKIFELAQYYKLLEASTPQSDREWQNLVAILTTGESYLFRDQGQINLLKNKILPELIAYQRNLKVKENRQKASLKIWSAGCSTGEEAYSLAILLHELLPKQDDWQITILGTDINPEAIKKAKQGIYNSWSFRTLSPELQRRYFSPHHSNWKIDTQIQERVKFYTGNLIQDKFPDSTSDICDLDLIVCRNVFIYFNAAAITTVLGKFYQSLRPGGYLMTGHAELCSQELHQFQTQVLPESLVYQRHFSSASTHTAWAEDHSALSPYKQQQRSPNQTIKSGESNNLLNGLTSKVRVSDELRQNSAQVQKKNFNATHNVVDNQTSIKNQLALCQAALKQAESLLQSGIYTLALQASQQAANYDPTNFDAYYLMAQAYANLGQYQRAKDCCQQASEVDMLSLKPYYLLAKVAEEQSDLDLAKSILKKIIYLDPKAIAAYLELGAIYAKENDSARATKMRNSAFELLNQIPSNTTIEHQHHLSAGELLVYLKKVLPKKS